MAFPLGFFHCVGRPDERQRNPPFGRNKVADDAFDRLRDKIAAIPVRRR
jgi:hypothetical protein